MKIGEYAKVDNENRVFKIMGITGKGSLVIPEGWLIDKDGFNVNPKFCSKYKGATSVINE